MKNSKNVSVKNIIFKKQKFEFMIYKNLIEKSFSFVIKKGKFTKINLLESVFYLKQEEL